MKRGLLIALAIAAIVCVMLFTVKDKQSDNHSAERMKKVRAAKKRKAQARAEMQRTEMKIAS